MKKLNNLGFGAVEAILIVVIIGLIGGAGYFVYSSQQKTNSTLDNISDSQSNPKSSEKKAEAKEQKQYFEVKEMAVKFELPDSLKGLYYTIGNDGKTAYFSLNDLKDTQCAADQTAQVALSRYTDNDFANDEMSSGAKEKSKKIGNYYYFVTGGQSQCSDDTSVQDKASQMRANVAQLLPEALLAK